MSKPCQNTKLNFFHNSRKKLEQFCHIFVIPMVKWLLSYITANNRFMWNDKNMSWFTFKFHWSIVVHESILTAAVSNYPLTMLVKHIKQARVHLLTSYKSPLKLVVNRKDIWFCWIYFVTEWLFLKLWLIKQTNKNTKMRIFY